MIAVIAVGYSAIGAAVLLLLLLIRRPVLGRLNAWLDRRLDTEREKSKSVTLLDDYSNETRQP